MVKAKFDQGEVINAATQLFWQNGYAQSSIQDITRVTGLQPGSIYHAYGSKLGLFKRAIDHYGEQNKAALVAALLDCDDVPLAICQLLLFMINDAHAKDYCSCFLVKSQLELTDDKTSSAFTLVQQQLQAAEEIFCEALEKDFSKEQARAHASSLMMHIFGIRVYGLLNDDLSAMIRSAQQGLPWLPWERALGQQ